MMNIGEYLLVTEYDPQTFNREVNARMDEGWCLRGDTFIDFKNDTFCQVLVR